MVLNVFATFAKAAPVWGSEEDNAKYRTGYAVWVIRVQMAVEKDLLGDQAT